jgi:hypothetical protein
MPDEILDHEALALRTRFYFLFFIDHDLIAFCVAFRQILAMMVKPLPVFQTLYPVAVALRAI